MGQRCYLKAIREGPLELNKIPMLRLFCSEGGLTVSTPAEREAWDWGLPAAVRDSWSEGILCPVSCDWPLKDWAVCNLEDQCPGKRSASSAWVL